MPLEKEAGLKGSHYHVMVFYCLTVLLFFFFFFLARLLLLITYPICDTVRLTLYEREVLAPAAGHRGASGLISSQVIRQTGGAYRQGRGGTGGGRQSGGRIRGLWDGSIPAGVGLFSRGTPAVLDRLAEGR